MIENATQGEIVSSLIMLMGALFMVYISYITFQSQNEHEKKEHQHQKNKKIANNCY